MRFSHSLLLVTSCIAISGAFYAPSEANAAPTTEVALNQDTIESIVVQGNQRIEARTVVSYLGLAPGARFSQVEIDRGLKNLFGTGFFADVKMLRSGSKLVVKVKENPIVNQVGFEGNDRVDTADLEKEIELKSRSIFTQGKIQNDVKRILDIYRRGGRYTANVEPKIIPLDQNRVNLVYEITEGPVAHVKKINFIGNSVFTDDALEKTIRTSEERWYQFFSDDDKYDPDRLLYDQELLRRMYVREGYADFQVRSAHAELTPARDGFVITFVVEEGPQYTMRSVNVESQLKDQETPDFGKAITTEAGETYNASLVEDSIDAMTKELGNRGYAFVDIKPKLVRDRDAKAIDLTYVIRPGPKVYVERINITGNVRTLDRVIRREFRLSEGDPYNTSKMQRSEQRLNNLGFFDKVDVKTEQGSRPDRTVVNVDVQEKSTGEINLGAGYSTADGAISDLGITERNFLGRGQEVRTRFTYAARRKQAEFGFTEPYFLNRQLAAGFDIYRTKQDFLREGSYNINLKGFQLRAAYALAEKLEHSVNYTLRENNITDVEPTASLYIKRQEGKNLTSAIGQAFTYDDRNNKFDPTDGWYLELRQDIAGLGGDSQYLKHEIKAAHYYPIAKGWTWSVIGAAGQVLGLGQDVRINDRFFLGGQDLRGFRQAGVGPRDVATNDALGGNIYYTASTEVSFPLGLPEELGFSGALFTDVGSLWDAQDIGTGIFDSNTPRVSVGAGLGWKSPFGPIRLDFAIPVVKENEDRTEHFRFNFGTRF